jgi:hypothetical protein
LILRYEQGHIQNLLTNYIINKKIIIQHTFLSNKNYQNNILLYIKNNKKIKLKIIDNQVDEENFSPWDFIFWNLYIILSLSVMLNKIFLMKVIKQYNGLKLDIKGSD